MRRFLILLITALPFYCLAASETATHCKTNEEIQFNCLVENSSKIGSLCVSRDKNETKTVSYVQYRFGNINRIEFVFPKTTNKKDQINKFYADSGITRDKSFSRSEVSFRNGQWNYRLAYFEEELNTDNPTNSSIIQVWKTDEKPNHKIFTCGNSDAGEKLNLEWLLKDISTPEFKYSGTLW